MNSLITILFFSCSLVNICGHLTVTKYILRRNLEVSADAEFQTHILKQYAAPSRLTCAYNCKNIEATCRSFYYNADVNDTCILVSTSFLPTTFTESTKSWQFFRERCPNDENCFWNKELGKCLCFFLLKKTWYGARDFCLFQDGIVAKGWTSYIFFVAGTDTETEGSFKWLDGSLFKGTWVTSIDYGQEPNGGTAENCLVLWSDENVNFADVSCYKQLSYICEWVI